MGHLVNPASIFLPMLVIVALTFVAFVRMAAGRAAAREMLITSNRLNIRDSFATKLTCHTKKQG